MSLEMNQRILRTTKMRIGKVIFLRIFFRVLETRVVIQVKRYLKNKNFLQLFNNN